MPVCTNCAYPAQHVYTTYKTKSNIRLGVCERCDQFLDPLIEHPDLIILLDLILLKPRVFLHLLFNRGSPPFDADKGVEIPAVERQERRKARIHQDVWKLGYLSVIAETTLRLLPAFTAGGGIAMNQLIRIGSIVLVEGIAQHAVTLCLALSALRLRGWYTMDNEGDKIDEKRRDGRRENFLPSLIPLTILYTSLVPLLLQLLLSIWYTPPPSIHEHLPSTSTTISFLSTLPFKVPPELMELETTLNHAWSRSDRIWVGTRLLGGMSAGFGLRVLLPTKPWETTAIVLAGWLAAAWISQISHILVGS
ncbi:hypothetical protein I302_108960 [Kwoniella bestiolae CBS 10118]|uniref:Protein ARV n=1 Tax=Kwoniella bestiolae CBS 10118 TaxID=1296100 RepID=A0A1B9FUK0_9TREE|nr:hypothetical protein I302_08102 [Kwoniella bestiolae CBS 10118]OCF22453.1 hypothetical protein I302_08102 [Kwoniella bestiolae CBS 10118]